LITKRETLRQAIRNNFLKDYHKNFKTKVNKIS